MAINVGIIGYGYWGPNLVRNFFSADNCILHTLADLRINRLETIQKSFPTVKTTANVEEIINNNEIDAVVIATPVFTHYQLAKRALEAGKHVLVEKPMTYSRAEAEELITLAQSKGKLLMVDHTYLYTGAVQKIKSIVTSGDIGAVKYFDSTRINLGLFQPDINVLWDLAPHDISLLDYIIDEVPFSVQATGISHTGNGLENIAYLTVNYNSGMIAHFNCSWSSPVKLRSILIGGDKKMILFDDMEPTEKVKIYETGYEIKNDEDKKRILIDYRVGDIFVPKISPKEALASMAADFINSIINSTSPISDARLGLQVVSILEASQNSIKNRGKEILL